MYAQYMVQVVLRVFCNAADLSRHLSCYLSQSCQFSLQSIFGTVWKDRQVALRKIPGMNEQCVWADRLL